MRAVRWKFIYSASFGIHYYLWMSFGLCGLCFWCQSRAISIILCLEISKSCRRHGVSISVDSTDSIPLQLCIAAPSQWIAMACASSTYLFRFRFPKNVHYFSNEKKRQLRFQKSEILTSHGSHAGDILFHQILIQMHLENAMNAMNAPCDM